MYRQQITLRLCVILVLTIFVVTLSANEQLMLREIQNSTFWLASVAFICVVSVILMEMQSIKIIFRIYLMELLSLFIFYSFAINVERFLFAPFCLVSLMVCSSIFLDSKLILSIILLSDVCSILLVLFFPNTAFSGYGVAGFWLIFMEINALGIIIIYIVNWISKKLYTTSKIADEARSNSEYKNIFLANMSHEIRTPMNAILGMAELILNSTSRKELPETYENALFIRNSCVSLLDIVNDILDFSKLEQGKFEIFEEYFDTSSTFMDVVDIVNMRLADKHIRFITKISPKIPSTLYGDNVRIKQVLLNILTNAVKFTHEGSVTLTVDSRVTSKGINLILEVEDTGIGIKKEDFNKIFSKFQQADPALNKKIEGTGLGLTITKELVSLMGGVINFSSEYGVGTTFRVIIPLKTPENSPEAAPSGESNTNYWKTRRKFKVEAAEVLVADDNEVNLKVSYGLLKLYGISADLANSGADALEMVRRKDYDLILLDHMMPEMDGIETLQRIRRSSAHYSTSPIVVLTANAISGVREMFLESGFTDYLAKPIEMYLLTKILSDYIPESKKVLVDEDSEDEIKINTGMDSNKDLVLKINGVNVNRGMANCGDSLKDYIEILKVVYESGQTKLVELNEYYKNGDYDALCIEVHGLKSVCGSIGEDALALTAFGLETLLREGKTEKLDASFSKLSAQYSKLLINIRNALDQLPKKEDVATSPGLIKETVEQAIEACDAYDLETVHRLMSELTDCEPDIQEKIRKIIETVEGFNYTGCRELLDELLELN